MRTQIAWLVAAVVASGVAEYVVSTRHDRDDEYWKSRPPAEQLYAKQR